MPGPGFQKCIRLLKELTVFAGGGGGNKPTTTVQSEPQGKGPSSMALGDREGFLAKWGGVGIFMLESGLG